MNTKINYKCVHNFYDGSNHGPGRDSPGALLDMLAEVASQTLHSEAKYMESDASMKIKQKGEAAVKRKDVNLNLPQILSMPVSKLVKHFAVFTSDELKRQYSYMCALVPGCQQKYTSFASEEKARVSVTTHLVEHLDSMRNREDAYTTFKATSVKSRKSRTGIQAKKHKAQPSRKPQETPNKENKLGKSDKSTSYLRKILSNEMNFKEFEKQKKLEIQNRERETCAMESNEKLIAGTDFKVLGDHSYYEQIKTEPVDVKDLQEEAVNEAMAENIMLMVLENDTVHIKEMPYITGQTGGQPNPECNSDYMESKSWSEDTCERILETVLPAKPKGKAKFIGTSKEEREMALVLIDRIKKKGNPTGNNLQCRICNPPRSFTAPTTLVSHYRSHAGIKPYECRLCGSVFTRRHSLKYHTLIHQNQTRFTCADCGKKFRHPSHFREHRRRHTGESPFGCADCGQRFKTRNTYKRHLKTRHGKVLTTTGELLCLTDEEFQKVQTNRKQKSRTSVSSDAMPDDDVVAATESIVNFSNDDCNVRDNNNESIEDYHVQAMVAHNRDANGSVSIDTDKTDNTIETEIISEDGCIVENTNENFVTENRVFYNDGSNVDHEEDESSSNFLQTLNNDNQPIFEGHDEVVEQVEETTIDEQEAYIVPYDSVAQNYLKNELNVDNTFDENICLPTDVTHDRSVELKKKYAYKIRNNDGNLAYRVQVFPRDDFQYEDTENYEQTDVNDDDDDETEERVVDCRSNDDDEASCTNNNNSCDVPSNESQEKDLQTNFDDSKRDEELTMVSTKQMANASVNVNKGRIIVLSKDRLRDGYIRINSNDIVIKRINRGTAEIN